MADIKNYRIGVDYKLYTVGDNGERILEEETTKDVPFRYLSGFAMTLDKFEEETVGLNAGSENEQHLKNIRNIIASPTLLRSNFERIYAQILSE